MPIVTEDPFAEGSVVHDPTGFGPNTSTRIYAERPREMIGQARFQVVPFPREVNRNDHRPYAGTVAQARFCVCTGIGRWQWIGRAAHPSANQLWSGSWPQVWGPGISGGCVRRNMRSVNHRRVEERLLGRGWDIFAVTGTRAEREKVQLSEKFKRK
ncbi:hypothetical protein KM043_012362 [Ampulex compressa]|nr:hypothetical protein KM043_012362 [Ampulex compressa]